MSTDLRKVIRGALVQTINEHGPIDKGSVESAAKRVNGAIRSGGTEVNKRCDAVAREMRLHEGNPECRCVFPEGHYRDDYPSGHEQDHYCRHGNWDLDNRLTWEPVSA